MFKALIGVFLLGFLGWVYRAIRPPPPKICGTPGGPPITGPRVKLRDGRYLSYKEHGVPKHTAKYKIVFLHGHSTNKHDAFLATSELIEELKVYLVTFDRPGYGESDPHSKRTIKTTALDIEDLADQLDLGPKFYVVGHSMGGLLIWGCLKYIPHRLAGAVLLAPAINFWWPGLPETLSREAFDQLFPLVRWTIRIAHYTPWLVYWWKTQKWFQFYVMPKLNPQDSDIISKLHAGGHPKVYSTQQGIFESYFRDEIVGFGKWKFDPMDLQDPFVGHEGSVHLWHGEKDRLSSTELQCYTAKRLPWIHYHEVPNGGHLFPYIDGTRDVILKTLLTGEK